jgi:glycosyltransferase involved in cell wall biosynthesis
MHKLKLAIVNTHPVQYYAPMFKLLAAQDELSVHVFYTWNPAASLNYDPDFGKAIVWDIPLLEGYGYTFVENTASNPGSSHFKGVVNPDLIKQIEAWGAQLVLVFGWSFHSHLQAIRYFKGKIPVLFRGDSHLLDEKPLIQRWVRRILLQWIYRHIDCALYVGKNNKQYFKVHGLKEEQLIFVPHAIDNTRFWVNAQEMDRQALAWRASLCISEDSIVFLFAGKLEPKKDPLLLLQAFIALNNAACHLIFIGNGVLEMELKTKASSYTHVHFIDFQNQSMMPIAYRLGNIFVLPSKGPGETWGLAVNEAMACRLPILVSNKVGCAEDLVEEDTNGYIFTAGDAPHLLSKMRQLLTKGDALKRMGECSLSKITQWSYERQVSQLLQTIQLHTRPVAMKGGTPKVAKPSQKKVVSPA